MEIVVVIRTREAPSLPIYTMNR